MAAASSTKPVRSYFEEKGFTVDYDPVTKEAIITGPGGTERFKGEIDPRTGRMYGAESRLAAIAERLGKTGGSSSASTSGGGSLPPAGDRVVRGLSSEDILNLLSHPEGESPPPKSVGGFGSGWYLGPGGELYLPSSQSSAPTTVVQEDPWVSAMKQRLAALESENAALRSEVAGLRGVVGQLYNNPYASSPQQSSPASSSPQQSSSPPATIPPEVKVEGVTPAEPKPSAAESQAAAARSPGSAVGFEREVPVLAGIPAPSVDRLMELWREVTGREEPAMREYFQHPQFQRVLAGRVPVWMAANPTWRLFLMRLGLIKKRLGEQ